MNLLLMSFLLAVFVEGSARCLGVNIVEAPESWWKVENEIKRERKFSENVSAASLIREERLRHCRTRPLQPDVYQQNSLFTIIVWSHYVSIFRRMEAPL
jgi:hypothetical protein